MRCATPNSSVLLISPPPNWNVKTRTCSAHGKFRSHCFPKKFLSFLASKSLHPGAPLAWWAAITSTCFVSLTTDSAICIADVVGKSVSAALLMASVQAMVRAFARDSESPAWMCTRINGVLCGNIAADKFVTFFYAILDADKHNLKYCSAGHPAPLLVSSDCGSRLCGSGAVLGVFPRWKYEDSTVNLSPGARLLLFTDGITEAADPQGLEFGENALAAFAQSHCADSAAELNREILAQVTHFCEGKFQDDATLVVVAAT